MEDDLKQNNGRWPQKKMEDDLKKNGRQPQEKIEDNLKKNGKRPQKKIKKLKTNQSTKINLIGCDTIVNSPSLYQLLSNLYSLS